MIAAMTEFREFCGLPTIVSAIDGTHFDIQKPLVGPEDYFYFKTSGYLMHWRAAVDRNKKFLDIYVEMPGSVNDSRALKHSMLYRLTCTSDIFDPALLQEGFVPYLIRDKGYPMLP